MNASTSAPVSRIRALREECRLSRERLAVAAGVSMSTVYLAERAGLVSDATLQKLAAVLDVTAEELRP